MDKDANTNANKQTSYWTVLITSVTITCIAANLVTLISQSGGFTTWKLLPKPPSGAVRIVDADGSNVWIEANDGNIYTLTLYCSEGGNCRQWQKVDDSAKIDPFQCRPVKRGSNCATLGGSFSPNKPFTGEVTECIVADGCFPDPEYGSETYFALLSDGTVKYWQHGNGLLGFFGFFIISTLILPTIVAILISAIYLVRNVLRRRKAG
jgi:hypothetical protein